VTREEGGGRREKHSLLASCLLLFLLAAAMLAACEKPDASLTTSPSAKALIGRTSGNVFFGGSEQAPPAKEPPAGWRLALTLARFTELENGTPALQVVFQVQSEPGTSMELWLWSEAGTVAHWAGGTTRAYNGEVCFQIPLTGRGEALSLPPGTYRFAVAFVSPEGTPVAVAAKDVTHNVPQLSGNSPTGQSWVFRDLLGCPRGG
jgi:hypothetical protein